jgi:hypothetical protein
LDIFNRVYHRENIAKGIKTKFGSCGEKLESLEK